MIINTELSQEIRNVVSVAIRYQLATVVFLKEEN